jgi:hypothetical protein
MQSRCPRLWNISNSCTAGRSSETNQNGMTRFWSSTTLLHKQIQVLLQWQREAMRTTCLLDRKEEIALKKRVTDASSSSTAVDVLQRIHDNREKCQHKEDEQMVQILTRKDKKLSLQREFLQFKKQQREENLILRKQEAENVAKQAEAQLLSAEAGIMAIDIDKVTPHLKNYYIGMQRQIMERRGFATSDPKDA